MAVDGDLDDTLRKQASRAGRSNLPARVFRSRPGHPARQEDATPLSALRDEPNVCVFGCESVDPFHFESKRLPIAGEASQEDPKRSARPDFQSARREETRQLESEDLSDTESCILPDDSV